MRGHFCVFRSHHSSDATQPLVGCLVVVQSTLFGQQRPAEEDKRVIDVRPSRLCPSFRGENFIFLIFLRICFMKRALDRIGLLPPHHFLTGSRTTDVSFLQGCLGELWCRFSSEGHWFGYEFCCASWPVCCSCSVTANGHVSGGMSEVWHNQRI